MATLHVEPQSSLVDEPVRVRVTGLAPRQSVTLAAAVRDDGPLFCSHAHYTADAQGTVDAAEHSALGGTYQGKQLHTGASSH